MANEELRLEASVVDRFSTPLAKLRAALGGIKAPAALSGATRDFERLNATVARSTEAIRTGYSSAISGLGIQSVFAAGAIAGLTTAITQFASSTTELKALSRETGITVQTFRNLKAVAEQFASSPAAVEGGLKQFGSNLYDFRRQYGQTYAEILKIDRGLAKQLKEAKSPDEALDITLENLSRRKDRQGAARISELLFGTPDFARLTSQGGDALRKALEDAQKRLGVLSPEQEKRAEAFSQSIGRLKQSFSGLGETVGVELAPQLERAMNALDKMIKDSKGGFAKDLSDGVKEFGKALRAVDWETISQSFGTLGGHMTDIVRLMKILNLLGEGKAGEAWKEFKDMGARSAAPGAIKSARDQVEEAKRKLAEFDKTNPNDARRKWLEQGVTNSEEKLKKAIEDGAKLGIKDGLQELLQRQSYSGGGGGYGGMIHQASFARGGGVGRAPSSGPGLGAGDGLPPPAGIGEAMPPSPGGAAARKGMNDSGAISPFKSGSKFSQKAPEVMRRLMADFGLTKDQAGGIVGNLGHESAGFKQMQEGNPLAGRGGWGWAQWTGPRRRAFEAWAKERGLDPKSDEANYGFLKHELQTSERGSLAAVRKQSTLMGSMQAFEGSFERSGIKNWASRRRYTEQAMGAFNASGGESAGASQSPRLPGLWKDKVTSGAAFGAARESGAFGASGGGPTGRATLDVTLNGFPAGWKSRADGGELFRSIDVNRGRSMTTARDD